MAVETDRWGIIYNPKAGSRKAQKKWNAIRGYMESRGVMFDYLQSEDIVRWRHWLGCWPIMVIVPLSL